MHGPSAAAKFLGKGKVGKQGLCIPAEKDAKSTGCDGFLKLDSFAHKEEKRWAWFRDFPWTV